MLVEDVMSLRCDLKHGWRIMAPQAFTEEAANDLNAELGHAGINNYELTARQYS